MIMKITKIDVFRLQTSNNRMNSPIGCRIYTDNGIMYHAMFFWAESCGIN